jgi:receptor protein-tyrosine kinase
LAAQPAAERSGPGTLGQRIADLEGLLSAPYPSLRIATLATEPTSPASPRKKLALGAGLIGGLLVGLGVAFASQALDPRLRREEQLRRLFRLPILAWVPRVSVPSIGSGPLPSRQLAPAAIEAYRTLRATLTATVGEGHRSILITSSSASEGKTTTAINLAEALATAGHSVLLIEGDLRRPTIAQAIGVRPSVGIDAVLINDAQMQDAIMHVPQYGENLGFLIVAGSSATLADRLSLPTARQLVSEAEALADYVVIDSPPLTEVVDALPIAQEVDAIVIVARINTSRLSRLANLGKMLHHGSVKPTGIVVIGREWATETPYYVGRAEERVGTSDERLPNSAQPSLRRPEPGKRAS